MKIVSPAATFGDAPSDVVANWILNNATPGVITENPAGTPNLLLYSPTAPQPGPVANFTFSCAGLSCSFDASSSTAQAPASYSWTWGDGTTGSGQTATHTYATGGSYSVTLTVSDAGGSNSISQTVTVNRPPTVNAGPDETAVTGLFYTLSATFSDPDNDGPWSYTITWGDGSRTTGSTSSQGTITAGHTYVVILPRNFTIRVTVTDSHGASGSASKVVTVLLL